ncbi:MAG: VanZ family protein [Lapillicoccus sp.]
MLSDVAATALVLALAVGFARLLRLRSPRSWPRSLAVLLPLGVVVAVGVAYGDAATYLWRGFGRHEWWLPVVLAAGAAAVLLVIRRSGLPWVVALWLAGSVLLIGLTTLPSGGDGPHLAADPGGQLRACVLATHQISASGASDAPTSPRVVRRLTRASGAPLLASGRPVTAPPLSLLESAPTLDLRKLTTERLPNVALFAPLGVGIAAATRRRGLGWVAVAVLLSAGVEAYQAVFTSRVCSTVDVATNTVGVLVGWVTFRVATRLVGGR